MLSVALLWAEFEKKVMGSELSSVGSFLTRSQTALTHYAFLRIFQFSSIMLFPHRLCLNKKTKINTLACRTYKQRIKLYSNITDNWM